MTLPIISIIILNQYYKIMEYLILISLVIIIVLLACDKIAVKSKKKEDHKEGSSLNSPDIMGQPRTSQGLRAPNKAFESQTKGLEIDPEKLDIEYDENENIASHIPKEELDNVEDHSPNWEEEEEELSLMYRRSNTDNGFAQGVTFEELSAVNIAIQTDNIDPYQQEKAATIVQKIQGTELLELLENSMENASGLIAELLDNILSSDIDGSSSFSRNDDFKINDFI